MGRGDKQQRVVVFAGAGASKAVNGDQFPATREFFERLPDDVQGDPFFQFVLRHLRAEAASSVIDIEMVLWELQNLYSFFKSVTDGQNIVSRAVSENILQKHHSGYNFGHLRDSASAMMNALTITMGRINEQVYDLYSYEPTAQDLRENWLLLLKPLLEAGHWVDIFTTNYDLAIESALNELGGAALLNEYLGTGGNLQKYINLVNWQEDAKREKGLLTKLHGSLNWKRKASSIHIGDSIFTGSHEKQAIIYPGFKGASDEPFFGPFHEYLSRSLADADHLLVIGFAFRDDNIRQIFQTSLPRDTTLTQIDPSDDAKIPTRRKVKHLDYFQDDTVELFLESVL